MKTPALLLACFLFTASAHAESLIAPALQPFVESHSLAGAVTAVASKEKVLSVETVGFADVAAKKPMTADALFWIASMSKPITGTAFMMLVDEGKVRLDDPVEKFLPEFKGQGLAEEKDKVRPPRHPITIRNILSHTSGLPFRAPVEQPTLDMVPLDARAKAYAAERLLFEPETKYQYSNAGINTAGRIIEVLSGMKYEEFLQQRLFIPLGMKDTTFWPNEEQLQRLAKSYKPTADKTNLEETTITQLAYPLHDRRRQPMPAGGLFSTAADVVTFCRMILNGGELNGRRYLSEASLLEMTRRQTAPELKESYGLGWAVTPNGCGHGGAYATDMSIDRERGLITVFMVQHAGWPNETKGKVKQAFSQAALKAFSR